MRLKTLLTSVGLGAGLMYFLDPQLGNRRRVLVRDQVIRLIHEMEDTYVAAVEDVRNRARGVLSEMTAKVSHQGAPDWILEERVRSDLGRLPFHARNVDVRATGGRIHLTGPVLRAEKDAILKAISHTRGVHDVEDELQVFDNPRDIPALQGDPSPHRRSRPDWQQSNLSPTTRLLTSVGGSLLTLYGLTRKGVTKPVLSTAGLLLTARGVTNLDTRSMLGLGMGENAIKVNKTININASVEEVYEFWQNFENFPRFMNHVKDITINGGLSTWRVSGPAGLPVEFQSYVTEDIPNQLIAWETIPDSPVRHTGFVRFDENEEGGTRVTVQMSYVPPAGAAGHAIAQLMGVDPRQAMHEDLMRLKTLLEEGKTSTDEGTLEMDKGITRI